ncbi:MAG: hypothetical protein ACTSX6_04655 [Candidatus Heimdallarchaeaceae archaeon]
MKANNGKGNNPLRDGWRTPSEIFDPLNQQYKFTYDCCANGKDNKCKSWSSNFEMYSTTGIDHIYWISDGCKTRHFELSSASPQTIIKSISRFI